MSAADILERLHRDGLRIRADGNRVILSPRDKVTPDVIELVRSNKPALLAVLTAHETNTAAREARRKQAVDLLLDAPHRRFAAVAGEHVGGVVPVMVAVISRTHGILTGELTVPTDRWDPALFLSYLQEQDGRLS